MINEILFFCTCEVHVDSIVGLTPTCNRQYPLARGVLGGGGDCHIWAI